MSSLNKVTLIGNVGQDPEMKTTTNGFSYARVSLATSESWKDKKTGEKKELTTWHNLKFYDQLASTCVKFVKKGTKIYVEGSLRIGEYEKDGVKHKSIEIICKQLVLLGDRSQAILPDANMEKERWGETIAHPAVRREDNYVTKNTNPQRPLDELVYFDPKVNPLRNIPKSPLDDLNDDIPF